MSQTDKVRFMPENKLRRYILINYSELSVDLANKKVEFLELPLKPLLTLIGWSLNAVKTMDG